MYDPKPNPRKEHRQRENQRVAEAATLAESYRELTALTLELAFFSPGSFARSSEIKYRVNLANAKKVFRFNCSNEQCVDGDFDLSRVLAQAVAARQTTVSGELICEGWSCQTAVGQGRCQHILRYKLHAEYGTENGSNGAGDQ